MPAHAFQPALVVLVLLACACDESNPPPATEPPPTNVSQPETHATPSTAESGDTAVEPVPVEPAAPIGGPHCDQRELGDGEAKCIDYSDHTGVGTPRCFADVPLGEGPCPSDGVIGKCTLPATGVTLVYYEGTSVDAAKQVCATIDGTFDPG